LKNHLPVGNRKVSFVYSFVIVQEREFTLREKMLKNQNKSTQGMLSYKPDLFVDDDFDDPNYEPDKMPKKEEAKKEKPVKKISSKESTPLSTEHKKKNAQVEDETDQGKINFSPIRFMCEFNLRILRFFRESNSRILGFARELF
jgi:hypothetical protein